MKYKWTIKTLSDIADFNPRESLSKGTLAKKIAMDKLQPFCRDVPSFELEKFSGGTKFRNGDTIMARITPCLENGKTAKVNILDDGEIGFGSTEYIVFRAKEGTDKDYLYYLVCSPLVREPAIKSMVGSSGRQRVQTDVVQGLSIAVPPIEEQRQIGGILKALDDKIELNNEINKNLEEQAQAILTSFFIDFSQFGGTVPDDWKQGTLQDIANFSNGYAFKSKELLNTSEPNCYQVFKQGHINRGGGFNSSGTKSWYPISKSSALSKYVLHKGDVLMAMTDMKDNVAILGNTALMAVDDQYIVNQRVGLLRSNGYKSTSYAYIYLLTNSLNFLKDLRSRANSGVQVNLSSSEIKDSSVWIANDEVNEEFNALTEPLLSMIMTNDIENQKLIDLRDTLLPKLMSGELDVSNINL